VDGGEGHKSPVQWLWDPHSPSGLWSGDARMDRPDLDSEGLSVIWGQTEKGEEDIEWPPGDW
jgi:hypothetical protein